MVEKRIQINNNEIRTFQIITCPICGFTFRIVDLKSGIKKKNCPMCGGWLFRSNFNKIIFNDKEFSLKKLDEIK